MNKEYRLDQIKQALNIIHINHIFESHEDGLTTVSAKKLIEALASVSFDDFDEYRIE